jgi:hypothetical protein
MAEATKSDRLERELENVARFKRVAGQRANKALDYIDALIRTADKSRYAYTDKQVELIVGRLRQAIDQLEAAYRSTGAKRPRIEL